MSLENDGVWKSGVWATTVWGDGVWYEAADGAGVYDMDATAALTWVGKAAAETAFDMDATALASLIGASAVETDFDIDAAALAEWISPTEEEEEAVEVAGLSDTTGAGTGSSWPSKEHYRQKQKRQDMIRDDDELMDIIKAALPHILSKYRR